MQDIINHPEYPWDWCYICCNPNLTIQMILKFLQKFTGWVSISRNPGITMEDIINHPELKWNFNVGLSMHPQLSIDVLLAYPHSNWDWISVSSHPCITMQAIREHIELDWDWSGVSFNPNLNITMIMEFLHKEWDWNAISMNHGISMGDILSHQEYPWEWEFCFSRDLELELYLYVENKCSGLLLVSILDACSTSENVSSVVYYVFYNEYIVSSIIPYL